MKNKNIFNKKYFELTGCVHNHTEYSFDAQVKLSKIIKAAKKNELDYLTINDHHTMAAREDKAVKKENDLIVIIGAEINDPEKNNHFLVFNTDEIIQGKKAKEYIQRYAKSEAICFAAHPFEKRVSKRFRKYIWTDKKNDDFDGIEIWNYLSEWIGKLNPKLNGLFFVLFPSLFVRKPLRETLDYWDELNNAGKRMSAIGSVDAHSERIKKFGIKLEFLTHKTLFRSIRTNVLIPEEAQIDQQNILEALKNGNSYIVNYKVGNPYDFYAGIASSKDVSAIFGKELPFTEKMYYYFRLPKIARVKLYRNGKKIASKLDEKGRFEITQKGNYRLEIYRFGYGWIFTNNIYVV
ncbi:MAG: CehA/McbA family metallohydrolase [Candidatus Cloacimonadota bacterium]|nr:CehA/McbA family metallohydrolase [Candidatus Cloacimonadota bacterium]